jgi:hypothetical protein
LSLDAVISSSQPPPPDAELSTPINLAFTNDTTPTSDNIESALSVVSDKKEEIYKPRNFTSLERSCQMGGKSNWGTILIIVVVNFFPELGGASRMLKFLMVPSNMHNMEYVKLVGEIIFSCAYGGKNGEDDDIA